MARGTGPEVRDDILLFVLPTPVGPRERSSDICSRTAATNSCKGSRAPPAKDIEGLLGSLVHVGIAEAHRLEESLRLIEVSSRANCLVRPNHLEHRVPSAQQL